MLKRIVAILIILGCSTGAWMVLAGSINSRTDSSGDRLKLNISSTWGAAQQQAQPMAIIESIADPTAAERSRVQADLDLEYRQKGLLWYSTYVVKFAGAYTFLNATDAARRVTLNFYFPAQKAMYDDLTVSVNGEALPFSSNDSGISAWAMVPSQQRVEFVVKYGSRGLETWRYNLGKDVNRTKDFALTVKTNFKEVDFPANTLSPTEKMAKPGGMELVWRYSNLISGFDIDVAMPEKLQPGPLAGEISGFAPISLLLFFFVMFVVTTVRKVELHPMNYFFLAAAFFAFHLLLAYLVDHVSIELAFGMASVVSVGLVVSYLRTVVGPRFAVLEAGLAQFVYLVLFSFSFFLKGFTGLAITIGCIVTLFVAMQVTAKMKWADQFAVSVRP